MSGRRQTRGNPTAPIAIVFDSFGPYHFARLRAAQAKFDVVGIEVGSRSVDYPWFDSLRDTGELIRLFPGHASDVPKAAALRQAIFAELNRLSPEIVAIPGWGTRAALYSLEWCARAGRSAIMMCDSTESDVRRRAPLEAVKRGIVSRCAAGFASGRRSVSYLERLGMKREEIVTGYDVVDNNHFSAGAARARADITNTRTKFGLPDSYILSLGRLVEKKNLAGLLEAYARYLEAMGRAALPLVIAGDGPLEASLRDLVRCLGIKEHVVFAGHVGYDDLPAYYGLAACFALVSTVEQWGLVVNEAIASGLPVLVSRCCGASADLVQNGENGFVCATDSTAIASALQHLTTDCDLAALGRRSTDIARAWDLDAFVTGLAMAVETARTNNRVPRLMPIQIAAALLAMRGR